MAFTSMLTCPGVSEQGEKHLQHVTHTVLAVTIHMHLQMMLVAGLRWTDSSQGGCFYNGVWVW